MPSPAFLLPLPPSGAWLGRDGSLAPPRPRPRGASAPPPPRCRLQLETIREYAANLDLTLVQGGVGPFITFDAFYTPPPRRRPLGHPSLSQRGAPPPLLRRSRRGGWLPSRATR